MKPKILIIDGAESGKRVEKFIKILRENFSKEQLEIHYTISNKLSNDEYLSIENYTCLFIHAGDNLKGHGEFIFNEKADSQKIPLFIFSGGFPDFIKRSEYIIEVSYKILLKSLVNIVLLIAETNYNQFKLFEILNKCLNKSNLEDFLDRLHSLKHDYLNRIGRILPEINLQSESDKNLTGKYGIDFNTEPLKTYLISVSAELQKLTLVHTAVLKNDYINHCILISSKIIELLPDIDEISRPTTNKKKFTLRSNQFKSKVEEIKELFELIILRIENEK